MNIPQVSCQPVIYHLSNGVILSTKIELDRTLVTIKCVFKDFHCKFERALPSLTSENIKILKKNPWDFIKEVAQDSKDILPLIPIPDEKSSKLTNGYEERPKSGFKSPIRKSSKSEPKTRNRRSSSESKTESPILPRKGIFINIGNLNSEGSNSLSTREETVIINRSPREMIKTNSEPNMVVTPREKSRSKTPTRSRSKRKTVEIHPEDSPSAPQDGSQGSSSGSGSIKSDSSEPKSNGKKKGEILESSQFQIPGLSLTQAHGYFILDSDQKLSMKIKLVFLEWHCKFKSHLAKLEKTAFVDFKNNTQLQFEKILQGLPKELDPFLRQKVLHKPEEQKIIPMQPEGAIGPLHKPEEQKTFLIRPDLANDLLFPKFFVKEDIPSIPEKIQKICNLPCPIYPNKKIWQTHYLFFVPKQSNKEATSLLSFQKGIENPQKGYEDDYMSIQYHHNPQIYYNPLEKTDYFALVTKSPFEETFKTIGESKYNFLEKYEEYELPNLVEGGFFLACKYLQKPFIICQHKITENKIEYVKYVAMGQGNAAHEIQIKVSTAGFKEGVIGVRRLYLEDL